MAKPAGNEETELFHLQDAAKRMGISYPTLKQWIYKKKIRVARTVGGHYRVPAEEVKRLSLVSAPGKIEKKRRSGVESVSARNKLLGTIVGLKTDGIMAQITLDIGGQLVTSVITRDASREMGFKVGDSAYAILKSTEVILMRA